MNIQTLGSRLSEARLENGYKTKVSLAKILGVSHVTVSAWEKNEYKPDGENLVNLLELLGIAKDWLYHGKDPRQGIAKSGDANQIQNEATYLGHVDVWDGSTPLDENEVKVPYYMDIELAAGPGCNLSDEIKGPTLRFSRSTLKRCGVSPANAACVKVSGNSMEPRLYDGDVVGVDAGDQRVVDGKTYAINHDGMLRIKRLYRLPGGGLRINSLNSDEHPDESYTSEQRLNITLIGRVFWHSSIW
jgi:phage repressor protein C with HTH and peptisase S24 domain